MPEPETSPETSPAPSRRAVLGGALALACTATAARAAPVVRALDPRFSALVAPDARLATLYAGGRWCEGLCPAPALGGLVFSDVRANRLSVLGPDGVRTLRDPSNNANGNTLDGQGRLVTCEHRSRRLVRREADGRLTVLADAYAGKRLNSPNDVVLAPDGTLWFTDPIFGIHEADEGIAAEPEQAARRVYRVDGDGRVTAMTDAADQPNGLAFAPDGRTFYLSDSGAALNPEGARAIYAFSVADGRLGPPKTFARLDAGAPDGLACDAAGNLWAAAGDGVRVYAPDGTEIGRIATPRPAANLAFAGADGRRLMIAAGPAIHAIDLKVPGAGPRG